MKKPTGKPLSERMGTESLNVRLTFREEGKWWKCYLAQPDTMKGAMLFGTTLMAGIRDSKECQEHFMLAMQASFTAFCKIEMDVTPEWGGISVGDDVAGHA